jgi:uncharacterized protein YjbI with pentapeptide repeats
VLEGLDPDRKWILLQFLYESNLIGVDKLFISLRGANLVEADLSGADLSGAILSGADLIKANLSGAHLDGADLSSAKNLTEEQLDVAYGDERTQLPDHLQHLVPRSKGSEEQQN